MWVTSLRPALGHAKIAIWDQNDISAPPRNFNGKYVNASYHRGRSDIPFRQKKIKIRSFNWQMAETKCQSLKDLIWSEALILPIPWYQVSKGFDVDLIYIEFSSKQKPELASLLIPTYNELEILVFI